MRNAARILPEKANEGRRLSELILGIDWRRYFPIELSAEESVREVSFDTVAEFMKTHFERIYGPGENSNFPFALEPVTAAKEAFLQVSADCFAFYRGDTVYGIFVGNPIDWSSYYIRHLALLPEYQQGGRTQKMFRRLMEALRQSGVHRVEADIAPSNLVNIHILNKMRFNVVGLQLSDRWGALLRIVRFLSAPHEQVFLSNFCQGVRYQLEPEKPGENVVQLVPRNERRDV